VITTKSLVIMAPDVREVLRLRQLLRHGSRRRQGDGKQVGAVTIPRTSAVPMTFMHKGRQYRVCNRRRNERVACRTGIAKGSGDHELAIRKAQEDGRRENPLYLGFS
jgi:hypothetical protein